MKNSKYARRGIIAIRHLKNLVVVPVWDEELYDHRSDPNEWHYLAGQPEMKPIMLEHARYLPGVNRPPLKGSMGMGMNPAHSDWFGGAQ
jgi:hypothetical protein